MMVAHLDQLVVDEEVGHRPLPEMTDTELHAFHQRAATLAFRYREFFTGASMKCSRSATPVVQPGTLAAVMQSGRMR